MHYITVTFHTEFVQLMRFSKSTVEEYPLNSIY
jgi:hypothetical protein